MKVRVPLTPLRGGEGSGEGAIALACGLAALLFSCAPPEVPAGSARATATEPAPSPAADAAAFQKLVGRWRRTDSDYTIEIRSVAADGTLDARYHNPWPIHVARAQAGLKDREVTVVLELRDANYPGNLYTLAYAPEEDVLRGLYSHLGLGQTFDVTFARAPGPGALTPPGA